MESPFHTCASGLRSLSYFSGGGTAGTAELRTSNLSAEGVGVNPFLIAEFGLQISE